MSDIRAQLEQIVFGYYGRRHEGYAPPYEMAEHVARLTLDAVEAAMRQLPSAAQHDDRFRAGFIMALAFVENNVALLRLSLSVRTTTTTEEKDAVSCSGTEPRRSCEGTSCRHAERVKESQ